MSGQRQKNRPEQEGLAFPAESRSDAPKPAAKGTETLVAKRKSESLAGTERLMEEVCELENCKQALRRVKANKGSPGVDGMTVEELPEYLKQHGPRWSPDGKRIYFVSGRGGFFNVWGIRFDPARGRPIGEPFRVTEFERPSLKVPEHIPPVALSLNQDKLVLTMEEVSGSIWVMDNVDR